MYRKKDYVMMILKVYQVSGNWHKMTFDRTTRRGCRIAVYGGSDIIKQRLDDYVAKHGDGMGRLTEENALNFVKENKKDFRFVEELGCNFLKGLAFV